MTARQSLARGDIVLMEFPFTDLTSTKIRPAVIVGVVRGPDLIVAFITSQPTALDPAREVALLPTDDEFRWTGLRLASKIRADRLATLHRQLARRRLGKLGPAALARLDVALRAALGL